MSREVKGNKNLVLVVYNLYARQLNPQDLRDLNYILTENTTTRPSIYLNLI